MQDGEQGSGEPSRWLQAEAPSLIVRAVHEAVGRRPVILCGSRATGEASPGSDFDVAVAVPAIRAPLVARRLRRVSSALEPQLGVPITVNPVRRGLLAKSGSNLFAWKLKQEGRPLYPESLRLPPPGAPPVTGANTFSYLLSAVFFMLDSTDPAALAEDRLPPAMEQGARKALLHLAQLRLMSDGRYRSTLDSALSELSDDRLTEMAGRLDRPQGWLEVRDELLAALGEVTRPPGLGRTLVRNGQYAGLSALGGRWRLWALVSRTPADQRLAGVAVRLLGAVEPDGRIGLAALEDAAQAMPRQLHRGEQPDWEALRSACRAEWDSAHPLTGL